MPEYIRELQVFADGREVAQGCRIILEAREALSLRPALHHITVCDLSASSASLLSQAHKLEVRHGSSMLAFGQPMEAFTHPSHGRQVTSVVFSPGLELWQSSVSLSVAGGVKTSDTIHALLAASGTDIPLAAYTAADPVCFRPQSFFGRTCDALSMLAKAAGADIFLSPAGLCVSARDRQPASLSLDENSLLSEPVLCGSRWILTTTLAGWIPGCVLSFTWKEIQHTGQLISRMIQADNVSGPWRSELEVECS